MPYTDSDPQTSSVALEGVWLNDPEDAEASASNFIYGKAARSFSHAHQSDAIHYAGRMYPVVDYGEQVDDTYDVALQVPHGTDWVTKLEELTSFTALHRTILFRDNRGRVVYGVLSGYAETDTEWGTQVGFQMHRVDFDEEVVVI